MRLHSLVKAVVANVVPQSIYLPLYGFVAARDIAAKRRWAPEIDLLPHFVRAGDTVLDVGAGHGLYSYHLSRLVGQGGTVHAFEPIPPNLVVLERTIKTHGLNNVVVHPQACGDRPQRTAFGVPVMAGVPGLGAARMAGDGVRFDCDVVRLDDVIGCKVNFLKIDVEGAELFVLRGASRILKEFHPAILFEAGGHTEDFGYQQQVVFDFLSDFGYSFLSGGFVRKKPLEPRDKFTDAEDYFAVAESKVQRTPSAMSYDVGAP
jgi:FkbM family methyltransferase